MNQTATVKTGSETRAMSVHLHALKSDVALSVIEEWQAAGGSAEPTVFERTFHCDCGETWSDWWGSDCDDQCPTCGTSISPTESTAHAVDIPQVQPDAEPDVVAMARQRYAVPSDNTIEIDTSPALSHADGGCWVQAWVWVPVPHGKEEAGFAE